MSWWFWRNTWKLYFPQNHYHMKRPQTVLLKISKKVRKYICYRLFLSESAKASQGPAKAWRVLKPHHTHPSMQGRCHSSFFFKSHKKILSEMRKHSQNLLSTCWLKNCYCMAKYMPTEYLSLSYPPELLFSKYFSLNAKITKLDPSLILPFYSWFQISNVRSSF